MLKNLKKSTISLLLWAFIVLLGTGCVTPHSCAYREMYAHLERSQDRTSWMRTSDFFLVVLVEARHLDYSDNRSFLKTLAKHPSDGSKNGDVGHAWICLQGIVEGKTVYLEGGHSGELGLVQARYFDGIMNNIEFGCANPTIVQRQNPNEEPNPVKYLWECQHDGFFQWGSGNHYPTYAAKIDLTQEQFEEILAFMENYPFEEYSITGNQCSSFTAQVAALAGVELECEVTMPIAPSLHVADTTLVLWCDPAYSLLTISSPDILERSLMAAVREGRAEYALDWYKATHCLPNNSHKWFWLERLARFPMRYARLKSL